MLTLRLKRKGSPSPPPSDRYPNDNDNHKVERSSGHIDNMHDRAGDTEDDAFSMALDLFS